jgi:hypothetical protein
VDRDHDLAFQDWIARARAVQCVDEIARRSHGLKRHGHELIGPCPVCGGTDRFSINIRKSVFYCRKSGKGGDAIAMVQYLDGADFLGACETLLNEPPPSGESGRRADPADVARRQQEARDNAAARDRDDNEYRRKEIRRAREIWNAAAPISGSIAERYLEHRGIRPAPGAKVRSHHRLDYWYFRKGQNGAEGELISIHQGPAMVAAIQGPDGLFAGIHITYLDPALLSGPLPAKASGKAEIFAPDTGEEQPAKKVRGSAKGGHIHLAGPIGALRLVAGEGIETVYSVLEAELARGLPEPTLYWSTISLNNMGGRAADRLTHPEATITDKRGRVRRQNVPGPTPLVDAETPVLVPPAHIRSIVILGDGDSDRFATEQVLRRAAARWMYEDPMMQIRARADRDIRAAWADAGSDFNSMLRGAA